MTRREQGPLTIEADGARRQYRCLTRTHEIEAIGSDGRVLFTFGGRGTALGFLNEPTDIVEVHARRLAVPGAQAERLLAVADHGNHRIQLFSLDGTVIAAIDPWQGRRRAVDAPVDAGAPFFRLQPLPQLVLPWRLDWRAPYLLVETSRGNVVQVHLERALLPDFGTWIASAPAAALSRALHHFARPAHRQDIPPECLQSIASRVQGVAGVAAWQ